MAVSIVVKFYGAGVGDLGANVPKHADYLFHVPQLFGTGHLKVLLFSILEILGILMHCLVRRSHKVFPRLILCVLYSGGERVMARGPLGGDIYRLVLATARHNEQEMEILDTCQTCLQLYLPFIVDALLSFLFITIIKCKRTPT